MYDPGEKCSKCKACDAASGMCAYELPLNGRSKKRRHWLARMWRKLKKIFMPSRKCEVDPVDMIDAGKHKPIVHPSCGGPGA